LRSRLRSYLKVTDIKTEALHLEAARLDVIALRSEIEALIEESRLIKELKPKYNVLWRDDKSYYYVYFTKEQFPKVFIGHKNLTKLQKHAKVRKMESIGPFTDGGALRLVMKLLRRAFPYCVCLRPHLRDCLNAQIGRCPGFCCQKAEWFNALNRRGYLKNMRAIKMILRGQSKKLLKSLVEPRERKALQKIFEHKNYLIGFEGARKHADRADAYAGLNRIEAYDISNFAGKETVGAMTALKKIESENQKMEWVPDKNSYRKFKIKSAPKRDDPRAIAEILERRLKHAEWLLPDLIIIDGGITQYAAAKKVLEKEFSVKSLAFSKNTKTLDAKPSYPRLVAYPKPQKRLIGWESAPEEILKLAERAIYQTHNFVIRYHRQVRRKEMFRVVK